MKAEFLRQVFLETWSAERGSPGAARALAACVRGRGSAACVLPTYSRRVGSVPRAPPAALESSGDLQVEGSLLYAKEAGCLALSAP